MEKFTFLVPVRGSVKREVIAETEEEAREKLCKGEIEYESFPDIDTWYVSNAYLEDY